GEVLGQGAPRGALQEVAALFAALLARALVLGDGEDRTGSLALGEQARVVGEVPNNGDLGHGDPSFFLVAHMSTRMPGCPDTSSSPQVRLGAVVFLAIVPGTGQGSAPGAGGEFVQVRQGDL